MIDFAAAREAMVDRQVRPSDVTRYPIIEAMLAVPREEFVPEALRPVAYLGEHVPLAPGRVLLDPRVFAKLLDALNVGPRDLVLDVGCGLGYSAAVLARMAEAVVALESDPAMAAEAEAAARRAGGGHRAGAGGAARGRRAGARAVRRDPDRGRGRGAARARWPAQLKPGGRIAAIFVDGSRGQARLGLEDAVGHRLEAYLRCNGSGAAGLRRDESI